MSAATARAVLVSGPVGSGKTSVLLEMGRLLESADTPYAIVDADWLAWLQPAPGATLSVHDALVRNLESAWRTFEEAGVKRLAIARFIESDDELESIRAALPGAELLVVDLVVPVEQLEARLRARDEGAELAEHLALARRARRFGVEVAAGDERTAQAIAREILGIAGWQARPSAASGTL